MPTNTKPTMTKKPVVSNTTKTATKPEVKSAVDEVRVEQEPVVESSNNKVDYGSEIDELKRANENLMNQLSQLMNMVQTFATQTTSVKEDKEPVQEIKTFESVEKNVVEEMQENYSYDTIPPDVAPTKQVMVMSLCYGPLCLADEITGKTILKFSKYGEVKPVLYSTLMDIVNSNLRFAQTGRFFIMDKNAVYHLGLSEYYKNIAPKDVINNIANYSPNVIEMVFNNIPKEQKETIINLLIDKLYRKEDVDANMIMRISTITGVDIMAKVREMEQYIPNKN